MIFDLITGLMAMGASMLAIFGLISAFSAKSFGEFAAPLFSTALMSGCAFFMWTV